jgi:hypothetical protein
MDHSKYKLKRKMQRINEEQDSDLKDESNFESI